MKHFVKNSYLILIIALFYNTWCYAQVTIGTLEEPSKGSLLQLKDLTEVTDGNLPNARKGFSLPRVALSDRTKLYPMFGSSTKPSTDYDSPSKILSVNSEHIGLVVYNTYESSPSELNPDLSFQKGVYVWTGARWENIRTIAPNVISMTEVENGLTLSPDGTLRLGGSLTGNTTIGVNAETQDFKIDIANNESTGTHGFFISGLETQVNSNVVVVDEKTGKLGTAPVIPAKMAFFQSKTETHDIKTDLNNGKYVVVPWSEKDDEVTNNLLNFIEDDYAFELTEDCMIEVSGMVNYRGGAGTGNSVIVINATLQLQKTGESNWINYSSVRGVYVGVINAYRNTLSIPPALIIGKTGDKIRMVLQRPANGNSLGDDHVETTYKECGIVVPYGTSFSKSIKIIAQ